MTNLLKLSDETLVAYYESVRRQVLADTKLGRHRLAGVTMRKYADRLKSEMDRRRMQFKPIEWPSVWETFRAKADQAFRPAISLS